MYALDINKLVNWLLPQAVRKQRMVAWLKVLLRPVVGLHNRFSVFASSTATYVRITGQKRIMEYYINRFFPDPGTIYITDATAVTPLFIFLESENHPVYLPTFITGAQDDFIVDVPISLMPSEGAIRAWVDKYKLPTKRYSVKYHI